FNLVPITEHADVEVIADTLGLGALEDQVLQEPIDGVGHAVGFLLARLAAKGLVHRRGPINQEEETCRIGAANLGTEGHRRTRKVYIRACARRREIAVDAPLSGVAYQTCGFASASCARALLRRWWKGEPFHNPATGADEDKSGPRIDREAIALAVGCT